MNIVTVIIRISVQVTGMVDTWGRTGNMEKKEVLKSYLLPDIVSIQRMAVSNQEKGVKETIWFISHSFSIQQSFRGTFVG